MYEDEDGIRHFRVRYEAKTFGGPIVEFACDCGKDWPCSEIPSQEADDADQG